MVRRKAPRLRSSLSPSAILWRLERTWGAGGTLSSVTDTLTVQWFMTSFYNVALQSFLSRHRNSSQTYFQHLRHHLSLQVSGSSLEFVLVVNEGKASRKSDEAFNHATCHVIIIGTSRYTSAAQKLNRLMTHDNRIKLDVINVIGDIHRGLVKLRRSPGPLKSHPFLSLVLPPHHALNYPDCRCHNICLPGHSGDCS
jgi:hypothetical protein